MQKDITKQMANILSEFSAEVRETANDSMDKVSKEAASKLRNTSPKRPGGGDYAKSWRVKKKRIWNGINEVTVYNKDHYRLTHLLENGHVVRNKKGTYGRAPAIKHIEPVEVWSQDEIVNEIERELEK